MYTDPEEREKQIRNMSEGFRELATSVLPELRRSRLIINYNVIGRTDSEIQAQYKEDASKLSNDELLYAATLEKDIDKKEDIYKTTTRLYPNDYRAYNNVAAMELAKGNEATAKSYLAQAIEKNADAKEAIANRGLIALLNGDMNAAENDIAKASGQDNIRYAIGNLNIAKGKYVQAVNDLNGTNTNAEGLAKILTKDYAGAARTLDAVKNPTGITEYLHAIAMARQGNKYAANSHLKDALQMDPSLKAYADNDLELKSIK
jgi:tetratricopeptide (TPR) repeat protein